MSEGGNANRNIVYGCKFLQVLPTKEFVAGSDKAKPHQTEERKSPIWSGPAMVLGLVHDASVPSPSSTPVLPPFSHL